MNEETNNVEIPPKNVKIIRKFDYKEWVAAIEKEYKLPYRFLIPIVTPLTSKEEGGKIQYIAILTVKMN